MAREVMVSGLDIAIADYAYDAFRAAVDRKFDLAMGYSLVLEQLYVIGRLPQLAEEANRAVLHYAAEAGIEPPSDRSSIAKFATYLASRSSVYTVERIVGQRPLVYDRSSDHAENGKLMKPRPEHFVRFPDGESLRFGETLFVEEGGGFGDSGRLRQFRVPGTFCLIVSAGSPTEYTVTDVYVPVRD